MLKNYCAHIKGVANAARCGRCAVHDLCIDATMPTIDIDMEMNDDPNYKDQPIDPCTECLRLAGCRQGPLTC